MNVKSKEESQTNYDSSLKLLMYRAMPAKDSAWLAGFEAATNNETIECNPFQTNEQEFECWEDGWWKGFYEDEYTAKDLSDELDYLQSIKSNIFNNRNRTVSNDNNKNIDLPKEVKATNKEKIKNIPDFKKIALLLGIVLATFLGLNALLIE